MNSLSPLKIFCIAIAIALTLTSGVFAGAAFLVGLALWKTACAISRAPKTVLAAISASLCSAWLVFLRNPLIWGTAATLGTLLFWWQCVVSVPFGSIGIISPLIISDGQRAQPLPPGTYIKPPFASVVTVCNGARSMNVEVDSRMKDSGDGWKVRLDVVVSYLVTDAFEVVQKIGNDETIANKLIEPNIIAAANDVCRSHEYADWKTNAATIRNEVAAQITKGIEASLAKANAAGKLSVESVAIERIRNYNGGAWVSEE